jgi:hypothetical protein
MPRTFDTSDIQGSQRVFIDTMNDWALKETRTFYYTGYEKVTLTSNKTGKPYVKYYIYLLKKVGDKVGGEETLSVFASSAQDLKKAAPEPYQELTVTRSEDEKGREEWLFIAGKDILPKSERPAETEYPDVLPSAPAAQPQANFSAPKPAGQEEINIDDIPF